MYVTKPLSLLRRSPELLTQRPQEGPSSGYLVLFDEECETTTCFGLCQETTIRGLPFPQNKNLTISFSTGVGENQQTDYDDVVFLPVLDEPLSSNRYYVIRRQGRHRGQTSASSKEEDMGTCCCCTYIRDVKPRPFDASDIYQQVEIIHKKGSQFTAKSVASDGNPPLFLRRKHWRVGMSQPRRYQLDEATGLNSVLRARFPDFNFSVSRERSEAIGVGKWYCPFMFVKEDDVKLKDQMKMSTFYEVILEQRWDKIFGCENAEDGQKGVAIDVVVEREEVLIAGRIKAVWEERNVENEEIWFRASYEDVEGKGERLGLSAKIVERMKWEQKRAGWVDGTEKQVRVERREEIEGSSGWSKFGCYMLVERFVLKRMDKSRALAYDFKHTHQIRCKWE